MKMITQFVAGDRVSFARDPAIFKEYHGNKSAVIKFDDDGGDAIVSRHALRYLGEALSHFEVQVLMNQMGVSGSIPTLESWSFLSSETKNRFVDDIYELAAKRS